MILPTNILTQLFVKQLVSLSFEEFLSKFNNKKDIGVRELQFAIRSTEGWGETFIFRENLDLEEKSNLLNVMIAHRQGFLNFSQWYLLLTSTLIP